MRGLLIRHPEHFYVSRKGARDTVFLRDAYVGVHAPGQRQQYLLKEKHPLVDLKEKYYSLMEKKRVYIPPNTADSDSDSDSVPFQEANGENASSVLKENAASVSEENASSVSEENASSVPKENASSVSV